MNKQMRLLVPVVVAFLLMDFSPAGGDQIAPIGRVSSHVNVRQNPIAGSPSVGALAPGQTAELLESIPYWYHIRLSGGVTGYVSKAWTVLVSEDPADASGTGKTNLIIGSWNIKWFGYYSQDKHDYPRIADIIQRFDLVAIQEIRGARYKDRLDKIVAELARRGFRYAYTVSDETGYHNNPDAGNTTAPKKDYMERYAFMWDVDRLRPVNAADAHHFVNLPAINNDTFRQVPIVGDFKVTNGNGFDFRVLTVHTVYNEALNEVRKNEIQFINDWIISQIADNTSSEKDIIAMGDFNANPKDQPHHFDAIVTGTIAYRVLMNEPLAAGESSLRTTVQQSNNPEPDYFLLPVYDHILVSPQVGQALLHNPMTRRAGDLGVVEFDQDDYWQGYSWNEVIRAMSDHRPVWFKADYDALDID